MRKVVIRRPGGYDRLEVEEAPDPVPGPDETLVEVEAAGVNYADCISRMGLYESAKEYVGWPITPGFEVAGGGVLAVTRFGGYASKLVVPSHQVFPIPEGWDVFQAAGFPTVFLTAWYALFRCAAPRKGARLLVHSAAGGVGSALVQLGRIAECEVVGVVGSSHKVDAPRELGADRVIDKSREDLWDAAGGGYDAVFDANGVATLRGSYRALRPTGRLVVYGFASMMPRGRGRPNWLKLGWDWLRTPRFDPIRLVNENKSVLAFNLSYLFGEREFLVEAMGELLAWAAEGRLRPPAVTRYPLDEVARAHRDLESGTTVGKLVLVP